MYDNGEDVEQDFAEAAKWYQLASEQAHEGAQYYLGCMYNKGRGAAQDDIAAFKWWQIAAELRSCARFSATSSPYLDRAVKDAQYNVGGMYFDGRGVPQVQDFAEAVKWYPLASCSNATTSQPHHRAPPSLQSC